MCWYVWIFGNSNQHSKNATRVKCICVKGSVQFNFAASKAMPVGKFLDYCRKTAKESSGEYLSVSEWVSLHAVCLTMCVYVFKCLCLGDCVFLSSVSSCWVWVCAKGEFLMLAIAGVVQQGKTRASMMLLWYNKSINDADTMMLLWYSKVQQEHLRCYVSGEVGSWVSSLPPGDGPLYLTGNISYCGNWNFFGGLENFSLYQFIHNIYLYQASQKCFVTSFTKRSWLMFQLLVWNLANTLHFNVCIFICHPSQLLLTRGVGGNTYSTIVPLYRYHCACWKGGQVFFQEEDLKNHSGRDLFIRWGDYRALAFLVCISYEPKVHLGT